jgi:ATP phosphoribosyltransferase regulatory subunit HisZ
MAQKTKKRFLKIKAVVRKDGKVKMKQQISNLAPSEVMQILEAVADNVMSQTTGTRGPKNIADLLSDFAKKLDIDLDKIKEEAAAEAVEPPNKPEASEEDAAGKKD